MIAAPSSGDFGWSWEAARANGGDSNSPTLAFQP
jgi:hypothetical protein